MATLQDTTHVKGLKELSDYLETLAPKLQANVMRGALRAGAKEIADEVERRAPKDMGDLAESVRVSTRLRHGVASAAVRVSHIARFVEYGTRPHYIPGPVSFSNQWGVVVLAGVEHPGARPRPFLRPSYDAKMQAAIDAVAAYIRNRLATKHGLDVSHVVLAGDE